MSSIEQKARDLSRPILEAVARALDRWNVSPNAVTFIGMLLTLGVAVVVAVGEFRWAGVAYALVSAFDAMDGTLARVSGKGSRFGAFLDSAIDRFEEAVVFLGLIIYYTRVGGQLEIPLVLTATVGSLMVSYTRARAEAVGVACQVGLMTRALRVAIIAAGLLLHQMLIALGIVAATSLFTAFHRMYHVWRMTGGEKAGWAPPKTVFITPGLDLTKDDEQGDTP